jgi:hypothetical protein
VFVCVCVCVCRQVTVEKQGGLAGTRETEGEGTRVSSVCLACV